MDVEVVEAVHPASKAEWRALADAFHFFQIPEDEHQRSDREPIGDVNRRAAVAHLDQRAATPFEDEDLAGVAGEGRLGVLLELAVQRVGGEQRPRIWS